MSAVGGPLCDHDELAFWQRPERSKLRAGGRRAKVGHFWGKKDVVLSEAVLLQAEPTFTLLFGVQMFLNLIAWRGEEIFGSAWE